MTVDPLTGLLDLRSERNLQGVHPDLVRVIRRSHLSIQGNAERLGFIVIEGLRTSARQAELVKSGASRTANSRHLTGHAVDLMATVAGRGRWDWPLYARLSEYVLRAAQVEGVPVVWGGSWPKFRDGPHFELPRKAYP